MHPTRDIQTVTENGEVILTLPEGAQLRNLNVHVDDRGTLCEYFDVRREATDEALPFVYTVTVRPHMIKGWTMHQTHDDRIGIIAGELKFVLYDARSASSTYGQISEVYLTYHRRQVLRIPIGVWHAAQNIGRRDALFINMPTQPYNHTQPDKLRLPLENDTIPYRFRRHNLRGGRL